MMKKYKNSEEEIVKAVPFEWKKIPGFIVGYADWHNDFTGPFGGCDEIEWMSKKDFIERYKFFE